MISLFIIALIHGACLIKKAHHRRPAILKENPKAMDAGGPKCVQDHVHLQCRRRQSVGVEQI